MARLVVKKIQLSAAGRQKFRTILHNLTNVISAALENNVPKLKDRIAEFAPTLEEEAQLISYPGSTYDFIKDRFIDLRTAIRNEPYIIRSLRNKIFVKLGDPKKINPLIGFAWYHGNQKSGNLELRHSDDAEAGEAWSHLLETWEYGGSGPFIVTARDGGMITLFGANEDTQGLLRKVGAVTKHLVWIPRGQPFGMYQAGGYYFKNTLLLDIKKAINSIRLY